MYETIKKNIYLVVPFLWVFLSASRGLGIFYTKEYLKTADPNSAHIIIEGYLNIALIITGILILYIKKFNYKTFIQNNSTIIILYIFIFASILWSDFPYITLKRSVKTFGVLIMATILVIDYKSHPQKVVNFLTNTSGLLILLSIYYIIFLPHFGTDISDDGLRSFVGVSYTKNSLGQLAIISCFLYLFKILEKYSHQYINFFMFFTSSVLLILSKNTTCIILYTSILLGITLYINICNENSEFNKIKITLTLIICILLTLFAYNLNSNFVHNFFSIFGKDSSFTGRTNLWIDVYNISLNNWIIGSGYGAFWVEEPVHNLLEIYLWNPNQSHQGYLDIFAQLGIAGLIIILVLIMKTLYKIINLNELQNYFILKLSILTVIIINNFFESSILRLNHYYWFLFLLLSILPDIQQYSPQENDYE